MLLNTMTSRKEKSLSAVKEILQEPLLKEKSCLDKKDYIPQNMETIYVFCPLPVNLKEQLQQEVGNGHVLIFSEQNSSVPGAEFSRSTVIFGNPPVEWMNSAKNLKFWQLESTGFALYRNCSTNAAVCNMGDFFSLPCAETLIGGLLALYRKIGEFIMAGARKQWIGKEIRQKMDLLSGKNVILLGAGSIAREVARLLKAFGCDIHFLASTNPLATFKSREDLMKNLKNFDLVINTLPGTAVHFVDREFFENMKTGAVYANIGRGITTDERALAEFLDSGKLAGAYLDVTAEEPLPDTSPLWNKENIILTHHNGGGIYVEFEAKLKLFLDNFRAFGNGLPLKNRVDLKRGY